MTKYICKTSFMQKSSTTEEYISVTFISPGIVSDWFALKSQVGHTSLLLLLCRFWSECKPHRSLAGRGAGEQVLNFDLSIEK